MKLKTGNNREKYKTKGWCLKRSVKSIKPAARLTNNKKEKEHK